MRLSAIICTHNPREDYLRRTLEALKAQRLPKDQWELLLIDNASNEPLVGKWDLTWHPAARHIREDELGLTPARLRGIREARADLLLFVDDDNVLGRGYLGTACEIARDFPWVGVWGGGIVGEFEKEPGKDVELMLDHLAIRCVTRAEWGCMASVRAVSVAPCGAGMVIRSVVAQGYAERVWGNSFRKQLGRKGASLASAEDSDIACVACEQGFAVGVFPQLSLTHLIPAGRVEKSYLLRLAESMSESHALLSFIWDGTVPGEESRPGRAEHLLRQYQRIRLRMKRSGWPDFAEEVRRAKARGEQNARARILDLLAIAEDGTSG